MMDVVRAVRDGARVDGTIGKGRRWLDVVPRARSAAARGARVPGRGPAAWASNAPWSLGLSLDQENLHQDFKLGALSKLNKTRED